MIKIEAELSGQIIEEEFWLVEIKFGGILRMVAAKVLNFLRNSATKNTDSLIRAYNIKKVVLFKLKKSSFHSAVF